MTEQTEQITASDGYQLHTITWADVATPKGVVVIAHGLGEHSGRYAHVAAKLNEAGYIVDALDHRHHGRSDGVKTAFRNLDPFVRDLDAYIEAVKTAHPDLPLFLYGHSMGSMITTLYVLRHQDKLTGWISSGSPLETESTLASPLVFALNLLKHVIPHFRIGGLDLDSLSRDPAVLKDYQDDPLVDSEPTRVGAGAAIFDAARDARERLGTITLPVLIVHGEDDGITPVSGSHLLHERVGSSSKTLKVYPDLRHEIHNEPEQDTVIGDMVAWLDAHL